LLGRFFVRCPTTARAENAGARDDIKQHLWDPPTGMHTHDNQYRKAFKAGIVLPEGYTFVSSYVREQKRDLTERGEE